MSSAEFGYSDGDVDTNMSQEPTLNDLIDARYSRRSALRGGAGATIAAFLGTSVLAACGDDEVTLPFVDAGSDRTVAAGQTVSLQGTALNTTGSYTQTGGPPVTLTGSGSTLSFVAPGVGANTNLTFSFSGGGATDTITVTVTPATLAFTAVAKNRNDVVTVPAGHTVTVLTRLGDPIAAGVSAYANNGTDGNFAQRIGDHGDALYYYGLNTVGTRDDFSSTRGLLVQNHENITGTVNYMHPNGPTNVATGPRPEPEVIKEIEAHGVSVVELVDAGNRAWSYVQGSTFNRRITPFTPVTFTGPVRGTEYLRTAFSPAGTDGRGTINNCANGHTLWGTNLTCEENYAGYFRRSGDDAQRTARELTSLRRNGVTSSTGNYAWSNTPTTNTGILRFDARATGASATADYRNEPNQFGWVVEIDPYNPSSTPRKRTALGRMGHEGAWLGRLIPGQPVVAYLGDDANNEYFYKFVSNANWVAADAQAADRLAVGDKYLDVGTLYVARFNANGSGTWLPLVFGQVPARPAVGAEPAYTFADQADILVNARLAADAVGATPMDRPEWTATDPRDGAIYLTLTNNSGRVTTAETPTASQRQTDAANPRVYIDPPSTSRANRNGHIIRLREAGDNAGATTFTWDNYLFGADSADSSAANVNLSGLTADNDFSSPDGLWFARSQNASGQGLPLLWIQTDDGNMADRTNNQMLAALPGRVGDGGARTIQNVGPGGTAVPQATIVGAAATTATLKRFMVGPNECELTGVDTTPDGRTLFVGIQHPGENGTAASPTSNWPQSQTGTASGRPRSAVVVVTRTDGGIVGI